MSWIDVHAHLNFLEEGPEEAIRKAQALGVERIITIGTEPPDLPIVLELAQKYHPVVHCTLGVHPHEGQIWSEQVKNFILENAQRPEVVAIGEIGLDYYYKNSPIEEQKRAFREQLAIAEQLDLPVEIHTRDAEDDTIAILQEFEGRVKGLIHCFTGTMKLAQACLDLGLNISFSGVITFKNADDLREVVKYVPLDRLHVETDSPFLAPVPHRGKKCTPAFVVNTAEKVAELKGISLEDLKAAQQANARKLFKKLVWN